MDRITSIQENIPAIKKTDIAVIGMAARFPGATNYEEFWNNLKNGKSSIQEVPKDRWDWQSYWGDPQTEKNKSNSKWGGFIAGVDNFDPDFFGMSAKEVERMDPQQRIMLELTWSCLEDAGIRPSQLSGKKVGVFLGVFNFDYKELQEKNSRASIEAHHSTGTASAIIANRISYYFNFKGPSIPIDTACSSSLSAIHSSIQSLLHGECSVAVAGGINLLLTPTRHISFSKTGMLSPTGSCKTFDDSADGYVRGEGAGLLLLKPLEQAILDNDPIYGIIKGSAVNHSGKTYSLTYPNPDAQGEVIKDAQKMAGFSPETISYIEAHGTGTPKGDPIEFQGLTQAFQSGEREETDAGRSGYCGLGSVKTNVGHLEAVAGVAGLIKVLLSMKYRQLPGLHNFQKLNHRITLDNSPFYIVTKLKEWQPLRDINNEPLPRRAGVSSFGFGGTNAHVVVEEAPKFKAENNEAATSPYYLVCLSAKTEENLLQKEKDLVTWLNDANASIDIVDICKTLSVGREHFQKRTIVLADSIQQLKDKLTRLTAREDVEGCFRNITSENKKEPGQQLFAEVGKMITEFLYSNQSISKEEYYQKLSVLAELYLKGYEMDWERPWFGSKGKRIGLPAYSFTKERYWIPDWNLAAEINFTVDEGSTSELTPLVQNTSNFQGQKFSTTLTGKEFFIKDHVVKGKPVLPGVAYLEMVRMAVMESTKGLLEHPAVLCLKSIIWAQPVIVEEEPVSIHTSLILGEGNTISFEVFAEHGSETKIHSQGIAQFEEIEEAPSLSIKALEASCNKKVFSKEQCYTILKRMGFDYGPAHQGLQAVHAGNEQLLARLSLPAIVADTLNKYFLHPSLLDAALQAALLIDSVNVESDSTPPAYLPFALDRLEIVGPCVPNMCALIRYQPDNFTDSDIRQFDIDLCDDEGKVCVRMKGFSFKRLQSDGLQKRNAQENGILLLKPVWKESSVSTDRLSSSYIDHLIFICEPPGSISESRLDKIFPYTRYILLEGSQKNVGQRYQSYSRRVFEEIQALLKNKPKGKVLVQVLVVEENGKNLFSGISGLLKTAGLENSNFEGQFIRISSQENITQVLKENAFHDNDCQIKYVEGKRSLIRWEESGASYSNGIPWKENGVYLITGGAKGLGFLFAKEIATQVKNPSLILTGRSSLNEIVVAGLNDLKALGANAVYKQADVSDKVSVKEVIEYIQKEFKGLNGIIHSAGIIQDNFIIKKAREEWVSVLSPKVLGVTYLDEITQEIPLDFFAFFSSVVSCLGNTGQSDYAAANAYLDEYAVYRNSLVSLKERSGHTLSINWPLWKEGGMQLEGEMEQAMLEKIEMSLLETNEGIRSFYQALASKVSQVLVAPGRLNRLRKKFLETGHPEVKRAVPKNELVENARETQSTSPAGIPEEIAHSYFKELLSDTIKRPIEKIEADTSMDEYGIDSVMVMQMTNKLESVFGTLPKTLFFEYRSIRELTQYFLDNYPDKLAKKLSIESQPVVDKAEQTARSFKSTISFDHRSGSRFVKNVEDSKSKLREPKDESTALDIAIIGMSGRYPQAKNLHEYWNNLVNGKDCITEIPKERWDYRLYFDGSKEDEGKSYSKWGGFLNDVDKFDASFFNITPAEAERMDPQERLFMQCVYEAIEDAGYTRSSLSTEKQFGLGNQVGVYVGVMYEEYQLFGAQEALLGRPIALWGQASSVANRVSYFCDFHGPSMAIDTMCSSSLTAIHLACESLVRGKCEVAVAGGVNVSIHPNKYLLLSQLSFASSKGKCESFGVGGDGYVPGEGVGTILLKPLAKAIADGDNIYGVIKSTAVSHGGKANGYTVPNPVAQGSTISRAFKEAGIDPRTISYIEAHGTGTSLGDPIEVLGLSKAFREYTTDNQFCAIGSAKSNIGHCESAAGVAGVAKVLLQLKHRKIVPSLHSKTLNPNIDFGNSPFLVQQELSDWKRPVLGQNGSAKEYPLRAGVSSYGAGGANAHVIIEEYIPTVSAYLNEQKTKTVSKENPVMILLSGKDESKLEEVAKQLLTAVQKKENRDFWRISEDRLSNIAYTLQVGREHMEGRLALLVTSIHELEQKLEAFISGNKNVDKVYHRLSQTLKNTETTFASNKNVNETTREWISEKRYEEILTLWVKGVKIDWKALYTDKALYQRVSMPTYPFTKDRFWVGEVLKDPGRLITGNEQVSLIHPLLHENTSDLTGQRFSNTFSGDEFYLKDHIVNGQKILPAVAYLEMIREAVWQSVRSFSNKSSVIILRDVVWTQPIIVKEERVGVNIELYQEENGQIGFEVYRNDPDDLAEKEIFSQGNAIIAQPEISGIAEQGIITRLQKECNQKTLTRAACYEAFERIGFQYGPTHQGIEKVFIGTDKLLAKIIVPVPLESVTKFLMHPGLMDSALQASLFWNLKGLDDPLKMVLPVAVEAVEIYHPTPSAAWVVISKSNSIKDTGDRVLNFEILAEAGDICVRLKSVSFKAITSKGFTNTSARRLVENFLILPTWERKDVLQNDASKNFKKHLLISCLPERMGEALRSSLSDMETIVLAGYRAKDYGVVSLQIFQRIQTILRDKEKGNILVQVLVPSDGEGQVYAGVSGLLKTAHKENPGFYGQVISVSDNERVDEIKNKIKANSISWLDEEIRYVQGEREVSGWKILEDKSGEEQSFPWKNDGVYLITGGAGGLGFVFANEIVDKATSVTLVLTGRSSLSNDQQSKITELEKRGAKVSYQQTDITDPVAVDRLVQLINDKFGRLNGIIHSAGVIRDNYLIHKTDKEWNEVLAPKVEGIQNLDLATKDEPLDFFVFFSSITGAVGNAGQADYAAANSFMNKYAGYRNALVQKGMRKGYTVSQNWPLWREGGMNVSKEAEDYLFDSMGIVPLETSTGIQAFYRSLRSQHSQVIIVEGDRERIQEKILLSGDTNNQKQSESHKPLPTNGNVLPEAIEYFKKMLSSVIKLPVDKIKDEISLEEYGIDSVMVMKMTGKLEKVFGTLSKTLFFEYQNLKALAEYFISDHHRQLISVLGIEEKNEIVKVDVSENTIVTETVEYFKKMLSSVIKLPVDKIKAEVSLEEYGIDSVMVMKMTAKLEKIFGVLSKTLFFEYQNLHALAEYFIAEHRDQLISVLGIAEKKQSVKQETVTYNSAASSNHIRPDARRRSRFVDLSETVRSSKVPGNNESRPLDIAIVGISGKYPEANNLEEFWENLCQGKDCIVEIPGERWNHEPYFDSDKSKPGKTYSKWGGFLKGVDEFDPLFFNISPEEAELIDPQERIFLQCAYETIEDAGYNKETLSLENEYGLSGNVGVFVGVMNHEYQLYAAEAAMKGRYVALRNYSSSVANRVSYFYNFNGPSMAIDTMCSSSLTALHLACQSIQNGDCRAAVAGGVNLSIHPYKYLLLGHGKFISSKGRCESFGVGGDGYVPSEGVGAVFLKPLAQALADGDHIYGVVKATSVNHGGKTNGYTVPNPIAQTKVIKKAYQQSGIDPRTISYLEAHGTGTSLGDPIEITGLKKAFQEYTGDNHFCAIGSLKSNLGHAESAAGIAGLTKVLLQLKHKALVPSLHSEELNPNIDFGNSPFIVQQTLSEWKRPVIADQEYLRRAGISAFGAGGSNAHVVIEEFDNVFLQKQLPKRNNEPVIILLSARNASRLKELAERFLKRLQKGSTRDEDLENIAFTLQTGRDALDTRLALIVNSIDELSDKLNRFLQEEENIDGVYHGKVDRDNPAIDAFGTDEELQEAIEKWMVRKKLSKLCAFWIKGLKIDWFKFYDRNVVGSKFPQKVSLPTYPFDRTRYWIPKIEETETSSASILHRNGHSIDSGLQNKPVKQEALEILTFEEQWTEQPIEDISSISNPSNVNTIVCFLSGNQNQSVFSEQLKVMNKDVKVVFVTANRDDCEQEAYLIDGRDGDSYVKVVEAISNRYGKIDAFLYLWPLEERQRVRDFNQVVHLLQAIGKLKTKSVKVLLAGNWSGQEPSERLFDNCYLDSWIGFSRSISLVLVDTQVSVIVQETENDPADFSTWPELLWKEMQLPKGHDALYRKEKRFSYKVKRHTLERSAGLIRHGGTYLITGGLGGLGLLFSQHLTEKYNANLILTGRSSLDPQKNKILEKLQRDKNKVMYLQADVSDEEGMKLALTRIKGETGKIDGVIHAAGTEGEGTIISRSIDQFQSVLSSKIQGTIVIDELLKDEDLDFVCCFSSSSAILGDFGSCDYAVGNRFQMAFANYRARLQKEGKRRGKTLAINWPLWKEGGMNLKDEGNSQLYLKSSGQRYLEVNEGIEIFEQLLSGQSTHRLVLVGEENRINQFLKITPPVVERTSDIHQEEKIRKKIETQPEQGLEALLIEQVSFLLKIPKDQLDIKDNLADLGFDSVKLVAFASLLSKQLQVEIVPALFFSYSSIEKITQYLLKEHHSLIQRIYESPKKEIKAVPEALVSAQPSYSSVDARQDHSPAYEPIAIIGMSGRFPQSRSIKEMWNVLSEGKNAVTEIPGDRFDWREYYSDKSVEGKTNCKWTAVIPGISEFDPLFFEIAPAEAKAMDPRQRLLLQEGWKALEDAGLGRTHIENNKIALYVGAEEGNYRDVTKQTGTITSNHNAILAARLSYFLNLSGPNMAINTSCSSGLVAAHQAFQSLQNRECDIAIAAGINLIFTPEPYVAMSEAGMLSSDGTCHTFDKQANGMVPGEAVAVVVLKRLSKAIADGDPIYATIKGSGINYDGKSNGITAPSGLSQTELLRSVYDKYNVNPGDIEYIVTHGTGTRLGDPIEINALNDAFKGYAKNQRSCALTSTKTNFGHTFAASGLVSLISLVQSLRYQTIPASLHCHTESDYILWEQSPFFINKSSRQWPVKSGGARMGAVSSFGMSGTNAHMVIEGYDVEMKPASEEQPYYLLPVSAKTKKALEEKISDLISALESEDLVSLSMAEIGFTLMTGRYHFKYRCALVAKDRVEAITILKAKEKNFIEGEVLKGFKENSNIKTETLQLIDRNKVLASDAQKLKANLLSIAEFYCQGYDIDFDKLFSKEKPKRVHLPTYPFSREEYWISGNGKPAEEVASVNGSSRRSDTELKKDLVNVPSAQKQWVISREELLSSPAQNNIDWDSRLKKFIGKEICIIYTKNEEKEGLTNLLRGLEKAGKLSHPLIIRPLSIDEVSVGSLKEILPDAVLFLGPQNRTPVSSQPVEAEVACAFQVCKSLMLAAWDKQVKFYYLYTSSLADPRLDYEALSGLFRSAMRENEAHVWKVIRLHDECKALTRYQLLIKEWLLDLDDRHSYTEIHYKGDQRFEKHLVETSLPAPDAPVFRRGGNYLVVGGTGYIGGLLLKEIAQKYKARLFILSRSQYDEKIRQQCGELDDLGATVNYFSCDVTDLENLQKFYGEIKAMAGELHGVINLARTHDTKIIASKSWESFYRVSLAKIRSAQYLDQLTKDEPLDFFIMFAAMAAYGAGGESDYAYSSAWQNAFVKYRNSLSKEGKRSGVSVAFCWGPWEDDKLFPGHVEKWTKFGCGLIDMKTAFPLIEAACIYPHGDLGINAVVEVDKVKGWFGITRQTVVTPANESVSLFEETVRKWELAKQERGSIDLAEIQKVISVEEIGKLDASLIDRIYDLCVENQEALDEKLLPKTVAKEINAANKVVETGESKSTISIVRETITEILQIENIDDDQPIQNYGLDSIMAMKLSTRLEKKLKMEIQPQWFIEFPTVNELSQHLSKENQIIQI